MPQHRATSSARISPQIFTRGFMGGLPLPGKAPCKRTRGPALSRWRCPPARRPPRSPAPCGRPQGFGCRFPLIRNAPAGLPPARRAVVETVPPSRSSARMSRLLIPTNLAPSAAATHSSSGVWASTRGSSPQSRAARYRASSASVARHAQINRTARAPRRALSSTSDGERRKSFRKTGTLTAWAMPESSSKEPPNRLFSVTTDSAGAPAASSSLAACRTSRPAKSGPSAGETILKSGMTGR